MEILKRNSREEKKLLFEGGKNIVNIDEYFVMASLTSQQRAGKLWLPSLTRPGR